MLETTLPQLEKLIEEVLETNDQLKSQITTLEEKNSVLTDENETLQLEILECEEKQKLTSQYLEGLLGKLQSASQSENEVS